jgi:hypothetical protein
MLVDKRITQTDGCASLQAPYVCLVPPCSLKESGVRDKKPRRDRERALSPFVPNQCSKRESDSSG